MITNCAWNINTTKSSNIRQVYSTASYYLTKCFHSTTQILHTCIGPSLWLQMKLYSKFLVLLLSAIILLQWFGPCQPTNLSAEPAAILLPSGDQLQRSKFYRDDQEINKTRSADAS